MKIRRLLLTFCVIPLFSACSGGSGGSTANKEIDSKYEVEKDFFVEKLESYINTFNIQLSITGKVNYEYIRYQGDEKDPPANVKVNYSAHSVSFSLPISYQFEMDENSLVIIQNNDQSEWSNGYGINDLGNGLSRMQSMLDGLDNPNVSGKLYYFDNGDLGVTLTGGDEEGFEGETIVCDKNGIVRSSYNWGEVNGKVVGYESIVFDYLVKTQITGTIDDVKGCTFIINQVDAPDHSPIPESLAQVYLDSEITFGEDDQYSWYVPYYPVTNFGNYTYNKDTKTGTYTSKGNITETSTEYVPEEYIETHPFYIVGITISLEMWTGVPGNQTTFYIHGILK